MNKHLLYNKIHSLLIDSFSYWEIENINYNKFSCYFPLNQFINQCNNIKFSFIKSELLDEDNITQSLKEMIEVGLTHDINIKNNYLKIIKYQTI